MAEPLLELRDLRKSFGALRATDGVSFEVRPGEVHALIGPNGAGKTTLIGQLAGELRPDSGSIRFDGRDIAALPPEARARLGLSRSFQITSVMAGLAVLDNVALALATGRRRRPSPFRPLLAEPGLHDGALRLLRQCGIEDRAEAAAGVLAHGEKRALELAMALALSPRLLLLDEPMAGTGPDESARLIAFLRGLKGQVALLLVEHDMEAVFALADRVTVLAEGRVIASGTPDAVRADRAVQEAYLGTAEEAPA